MSCVHVLYRDALVRLQGQQHDCGDGSEVRSQAVRADGRYSRIQTVPDRGKDGEREVKKSSLTQNWYGPLGYVRAASQIRVINGVGKVEAQLNTLRSEWAENIFANCTGQHRESI